MPDHETIASPLSKPAATVQRVVLGAWLAAAWALLIAPAVAHAQLAAAVSPKAQEADAALQKGNIDEAIQLYNEALADGAVSNDRRAVMLTERGAALMKKQQFKAALDDFNKAATIYPEYPPAYVNRGNLLLAMKQGPATVREAIKDFDRAIVLAPKLAAAFGNRGVAQMKLGQLDAAVADLTRAIELQPQNPAALNGRGRVRLMAGQSHAAIRDFTRAVTLNPSFAQSYRNRAEADMMLSLPIDAAEDLSRTLAFDARRVEDYAARGQAYLAAGNTAAAMTDFETVIQLDPKSLAAYIGHGIAKANSGMMEDALADLSRAIELEPRSARAYAVRAWLYKKNQQAELGEKDVERALRLEPVTAYARALGLDIRHRETLAALVRLGLQPQREDTPLAAAGGEGWQVMLSSGQFTATNPQFPALRVTLEMVGTGQPKIIGWDRQKAPHASYGLLYFNAGQLQTPQGGQLVESAAVVDLSTMSVIGMPITKLGGKSAKFDWDETRVAVTGADGLVETIALRSMPESREMAAATAARKKADRNEDGSPLRTDPTRSGQREAARHSASQRKPKTLFDLIFGN